MPFPPFSIIPKVLKKIKTGNADGILVVAFWPNQPWCPLIFEILTDVPVLLTTRKHLLRIPPTSTDTAPHVEEDGFARLSISRFLTENSGLSEETSGINEASWRSLIR